MIIAAKYMIPGIPEMTSTTDAAVRVVDGRISAVGKLTELRMAYPDEEYEDFGTAVIMPGFVSAHTHLEYSTMEGIIADEPYAKWKAAIVKKSAGMTDEDWDDSALIGALGALRGGITTISDVTRTGASLRACMATGMHGTIYREVTARTKDEVEPAMEEAKQDVETWRSLAEEMGVDIGIGPDSLYATHPEVLSAIGDYAMDGTPVAIHMAGSREECDFIRYGSSPFSIAADGPEHEAYSHIQSEAFLPMGVSPVRYALNWGILYAPNVLAIHAVHVDAEDISRLRETNISIAICPRSNAKLGCGIAPIRAFREAGLTVGLGTNSPAAADASDMLEEMRFALLLERGLSGAFTSAQMAGEWLKASQVIRMGTSCAARAIGMDDEIGTIEVGKRADLVVIDISRSTQVATYSPNSCVVNDTNRSDVLMTMLDGHPVYRKGKGFDLDVDVERLMARSIEMRHRLRTL